MSKLDEIVRHIALEEIASRLEVSLNAGRSVGLPTPHYKERLRQIRAALDEAVAEERERAEQAEARLAKVVEALAEIAQGRKSRERPVMVAVRMQRVASAALAAARKRPTHEFKLAEDMLDDAGVGECIYCGQPETVHQPTQEEQ